MPPSPALTRTLATIPCPQASLWPEHASLKFTFAHTVEQNVQYFVTPDALRPEMPVWAAPRMPIAQARSLQQPQEAQPLLSVGVRNVHVAKGQLPGFVRREWTCLGFLSTLEASRRVALLTALTYEPLATRTTHGRLQVRARPSLAVSGPPSPSLALPRPLRPSLTFSGPPSPSLALPRPL